MHEYVTVSASSYDPASLAAKLNERSAEGWDVVAIVPTGGDVTAFLRREGAARQENRAAADAALWQSSSEVQDQPVDTASESPINQHGATAASEPPGWAMAPESSASTSAPDDFSATSAPTTVIDTPTPYQPSTPPASSPAVPAGWYADPAGRFDLRYWDGSQWTEHVARGGQQFTDPPVA